MESPSSQPSPCGRRSPKAYAPPPLRRLVLAHTWLRKSFALAVGRAQHPLKHVFISGIGAAPLSCTPERGAIALHGPSRVCGVMRVPDPALKERAIGDNSTYFPDEAKGHGVKTPVCSTYCTISFSPFRGETFTTVRAGLAAIMISSPVKGLRPLRALAAGLRTVRIFTRPGSVKVPAPLFFTWRSIVALSSSNTATTSRLATPVFSARAFNNSALV